MIAIKTSSRKKYAAKTTGRRYASVEALMKGKRISGRVQARFKTLKALDEPRKCSRCKNPAEPGFVLCNYHRDYARKYAKKHYGKRISLRNQSRKDVLKEGRPGRGKSIIKVAVPNRRIADFNAMVAEFLAFKA